MEHRETDEQRREYLAALYGLWLCHIPWNIPVLKPYEAETKAAQPFGIGGRLYTETAFLRRLESETHKLLERAKRDIAKATDQPAILAALYEARNNNKTALRYWESREALEPDTMTETDRRPLTLGVMEAANRKARERVEKIKKWERTGVEVVTAPGATLEKSVIGTVATWIDDNIEYLENMGVQPRRAGEVVRRETEEPRPMTEQPAPPQPETKYKGIVYALAYIIDKKATGQPIPPGRVPMETDVFRHYKQFKVSKNTVYKNKNILIKKTITPALCFEIAGENWLQVIVGLSNNPEKVKQYIENDILIK